MQKNLTFNTSDWKREFPVEKIGLLERLLHKGRAGVLPFDVETRQAQFIDTNFYYRVGGVDVDKAKNHNDILAIQAGIGSRKAVTLEDQISVAKEAGLKYVTWLILDPNDSLSIAEQIISWFGWWGVDSAPMCIDLEKPRSITRHINRDELKIAVETIRNNSEFRVGCYSRVNIFESIFGSAFPDWFRDVWQWIAQYLLNNQWSLYRYYDPFLNSWEWSLPPSVTKSLLYRDKYWREMVEAWQITPKGDAVHYIAPMWIEPGQPGIKSCDLNVSMKSVADFMESIFGDIVVEPLPPIPNDCIWQFEALKRVNYRTQPIVSSSTYAGTFSVGHVVGAFEMINGKNNLWLKFEMGGNIYYSALVYNCTKFYKPL